MGDAAVPMRSSDGLKKRSAESFLTLDNVPGAAVFSGKGSKGLLNLHKRQASLLADQNPFSLGGPQDVTIDMCAGIPYLLDKSLPGNPLQFSYIRSRRTAQRRREKSRSK